MAARAQFPRLVVLCLVLAGLACDRAIDLFIHPPEPTQVFVIVSPHSGTGTFTAKVSMFDYADGESVICTYPGPAGSVLTIQSPPADPNATVGFSYTFKFDVTQPGHYKVECRPAKQGGLLIQAEFDVPQPDAPAETAPFKTAVIGFDLSQTTLSFSNPNPGALLNDFCWPPTSQLQGRGPKAVGTGEFLVGDDGALTGFCKLEAGGTDVDTTTMDGELTGQYDAVKGTVVFHLDTTRVSGGTQPVHEAIFNWVADGEGTVVGNTATGLATFTWALACTGKINCLPPSTATGTVPFDIVFSP